MLGHVTIIAIPRMTRPWKNVAVAMAVFGFVYGYVGTAGAPFCGSLGQCLQLAVDRGLAGFAPASLIPGAIGAMFFAGVVYVLFLIVYGIRKAWHRQPSARDAGDQPTRPTPAVRSGPKQWARKAPLRVALGAALAWAILSVGPASLADDVSWLIPQDTVTAAAPSCPFGYSIEGSLCARWRDLTFQDQVWPPIANLPPMVVYADPVQQCPGIAVPEADGMCHERSGGAIEPLMNDVVRGGQNGLLAFLAVGAALLLWPRLRAASQPQG